MPCATTAGRPVLSCPQRSIGSDQWKGKAVAMHLEARDLEAAIPSHAGTMHLDGLDGSVEVVRDSLGIPHIRAGSVHDAFFAQGYVHAQDRLWQMEYDRRRALGRWAEVAGPTGLEHDLSDAPPPPRRERAGRLRRLRRRHAGDVRCLCGGRQRLHRRRRRFCRSNSASPRRRRSDGRRGSAPPSTRCGMC